MHDMFVELCDNEESVVDKIVDWTRVVVMFGLVGLVFSAVFMCGYATARIQMSHDSHQVVVSK